MLELAHGRYDAAITLLRRVLQTRLSQAGALPVSVGPTLVALASALEKAPLRRPTVSMSRPQAGFETNMARTHRTSRSAC